MSSADAALAVRELAHARDLVEFSAYDGSGSRAPPSDCRGDGSQRSLCWHIGQRSGGAERMMP